MRYHPDGGPLRYASASELEAAMGEELRTVYSEFAGNQYKLLALALQQRRKSVEVSHQCLRTWWDQYASPRSTSAASSSASLKKRPAAAAALSVPVAKRPAAAVVAEPVLVEVSDLDALEAACGDRYRLEVSDKGLGLIRADMARRLLAWGFRASEALCREWLVKYRLGDNARAGNAAVFELSRQDLRRWYHVEGLSAWQLQQKYREVHGVYADSRYLYRWIRAPAQSLDVFENNEDIHTHACGEYVLAQLQNGIDVVEVVRLLREQYLVATTVQRVNAYRYYREQRGEYWSTEHLEREHWQFLYDHVSLEQNLSRLPVQYPARGAQRTNPKLSRQLEIVRAALGRHTSTAEEMIPVVNLGTFYASHQIHARLHLQYPDAIVHTDCIPLAVLNAFRTTLTGEVLTDTAKGVIGRPGRALAAQRIARIAQEDGLIVHPQASADACLVAAYTMSRTRAFE